MSPLPSRSPRRIPPPRVIRAVPGLHTDPHHASQGFGHDEDALSLSDSSPEPQIIIREPRPPTPPRPKAPPMRYKEKRKRTLELVRQTSIASTSSILGSSGLHEQEHQQQMLSPPPEPQPLPQGRRRQTLDEELRASIVRGRDRALREDVEEEEARNSGVLVGVGERSKDLGFLAHGGGGGAPVFMGVGYVTGVQDYYEKISPVDEDEDDGDGEHDGDEDEDDEYVPRVPILVPAPARVRSQRQGVKTVSAIPRRKGRS